MRLARRSEHTESFLALCVSLCIGMPAYRGFRAVVISAMSHQPGTADCKNNEGPCRCLKSPPRELLRGPRIILEFCLCIMCTLCVPYSRDNAESYVRGWRARDSIRETFLEYNEEGTRWRGKREHWRSFLCLFFSTLCYEIHCLTGITLRARTCWAKEYFAC